MPVLEGLLSDEHNKIILDLAFDIATWHAYAKLRKHTEHTLASFRSQTKELGRQLRVFLNKTCSEFNTKALPSEEAARIRRSAAKPRKGDTASKKNSRRNSNMKRFNMATYKIHALGDYADHIMRFGPTDCFTTQHVRHFPFCSNQNLTNLTHRVSSNTGGSSDSTSERIRASPSHARLPSRNECNGTIESISRR